MKVLADLGSGGSYFVAHRWLFLLWPPMATGARELSVVSFTRALIPP